MVDSRVRENRLDHVEATSWLPIKPDEPVGDALTPKGIRSSILRAWVVLVNRGVCTPIAQAFCVLRDVTSCGMYHLVGATNKRYHLHAKYSFTRYCATPPKPEFIRNSFSLSPQPMAHVEEAFAVQ